MARRKIDPRIGIGLGLLQSIAGTLTVRDLRRRDASQVRGPKFLWYLWGGTNLLGAALYWTVGRRRGQKRLAAVE